ncbi:MAG: T9SS type A sorting domain-containing protein [Chitinophagaceae bacterium]|nr:T9SS type A sorting domain-containing protein [Chitinophagaceae bacterium]
MRKFYLLVLTLLTASQLDAQTTFQWARQYSGSGAVEAAAIASDPNGYIYVVGNFRQVNDFDPGPGTLNLTPVTAFYTDVFITKLDASGNLVWAKSFGGNFDDAAVSVAVDDSGSVVIGGVFFGTCDFNPSASTNNITSTSNTNDAFIAKYDSSGNYKWARRLGNTGANESVKSIAIASNYDIIFGGELSGTIDFDPSATTANVASSGGTDAYVARYTTMGTYIWAKKAGGSSAEILNAVKLASNGDVLFTGSFNGTVDFDPSATTANLVSAGPANAFVARWSSTGTYVWAKSVGGFDAGAGTGVGEDNSGNIYVSGNFVGTADFDPSGTTAYFTSAGSTDQFIWKLSSTGTYIFNKVIGSTLGDNISSMHVTSAGFVTTTGGFSGTIDFDPNAGTSNLISAGSGDIYIARYNNAGNLVFAHRIGDVNFDGGRQVMVDNAGAIYSIGRFQGTMDFDQTAGTATLSTSVATTYGAYIHKMTSNFATPVALTSFDGQWKAEGNEIRWQTSMELNNDYFEIQRAVDAVHFTGIAKVEGQGNSNLLTNYEYMDFARETGTNYYRLKQVDFDGRVSYSETIELKPAETTNGVVSVFPNPSNGIFQVEIFNERETRLALHLTDLKGAVLLNEYRTLPKGQQHFEIDLSDKPEGVYILQLESPGSKKSIVKLFKKG